MPNSLSSLLEQRAVREVADRTIAEFEDVVKKARQRLEDHDVERAGLEQDLQDAKRVLATIRTTLGRGSTPLEIVVSTPGKYAPYESYMFHLDSRTGGPGHFMQVKNGKLTCSCRASSYDRECWAVKHIKFGLDKHQVTYLYYGSKENFDKRIRPTTPSPRIPTGLPNVSNRR